MKPTQTKRPIDMQDNARNGTKENPQNTNTTKNTNGKDKRKIAPENAKQAVHKGERDLIRSLNTVQQSMNSSKKQTPKERNQQKMNIAQKRLELDKTRRGRSKVEPTASIPIPKTRKNLKAPQSKQSTVPKYSTPELSSKVKKRYKTTKIKKPTPVKKGKGRQS